MGTYVKINDEMAHDAALKLVRGTYQRNILLGVESLSGATLRGRARSYSGRYAESRRNLVARIIKAGIPIHEEREDHGRRVLVIGNPPCYSVAEVNARQGREQEEMLGPIDE
jgi:hypothetical protein